MRIFEAVASSVAVVLMRVALVMMFWKLYVLEAFPNLPQLTVVQIVVGLFLLGTLSYHPKLADNKEETTEHYRTEFEVTIVKNIAKLFNGTIVAAAMYLLSFYN